MKRRVFLIAATFAVGLAGCSGRSETFVLPKPTTTASSPTQNGSSSATANIVITIPSKSSDARRSPKYISAATESLTVGIVADGKTTQLAEADLLATSPGCSAAPAGGTQCSISFTAVAGADTFAISTYSGTGGKGSVLSTGQFLSSLVTGQTTSIPMDLDGVPASLTVVLAPSTLPVGTAGTTNVIVQAQDASGNLIIGPGGFSTPISLAVTGDTYKTLSLSSTTVTAPGQSITLSYNGGTNVGSTITPSTSGVATATGATFAASGASLNIFQMALPGNNSALYPQDIAAGPNATAATLAVGQLNGSSDYSYVIAQLSPTGTTQGFVGDTADPYAPPAPGSLTVPNVTVVHGMSTVLDNARSGVRDDLAVGSNGMIYYGGSFSSTNAPSCIGGTLNSGTIGALNPKTGFTTERPLKGEVGTIKIDNSGNVWWIEYSGVCSNTGPVLGSDSFAIGEMTPAGKVTETPFSTAGLGGVGFAWDMAIMPDGSQLFIVDYSNSSIWQVATATLAAPAELQFPQSPNAIGVAADGTVAWSIGGASSGQGQLYDYVATPAFGAGSFAQGVFPIPSYNFTGMASADGSFWAAGNVGTSNPPSSSGIARIAIASGKAQASYYALPSGSTAQHLITASAGGGYAWFADDANNDIDALAYGAPSSGTITYASHRIRH